MKTVQDKDGNIFEVEDDTRCHPGVETPDKIILPIPYTKEELVVIDAEQAAAKAVYDAGATVRNAKAEIARLEGQITTRRRNDHLFGTQNPANWLEDQAALITIERNKL